MLSKCSKGDLAENMPQPRNRSIGAKVTDDEYTQLEAQAEARGMTLGEWSRELLIEQLKPGSSAAAPESGAAVNEIRTVLAEVLATRAIVSNVMSALARGEVLDQERIKELIRFADTERFRRAEERLADAVRHRQAQEGANGST